MKNNETELFQKKKIMQRAFSYLILVVAFCVNEICCDNKYTKDAHETSPFRMNKINKIWQKAQKRLKGHSLADLYADLKIHDGLEIQLKQLKAENMDKGGIKEAQVRMKLRAIVNRHNLQDIIHIPGDTNEVSDNDIPTEIKDKKLQKLWERAGMSGFSDEELEELKKEFWHQQLKLDEFNLLKDEIKSLSDLDILDNSLDGFDKEKNRKMKMLNKDIKDGYDKLETFGRGRDHGDNELEFKDKRVYELYALARKSNMTEDELQSFMEELQHFEQRISKHEYLQEEAQLAENLLGKDSRDGEMPKKQIMLQQKAKDYGYKVKKYHAELQKKISKALPGHTEL